MNNHELLDLIDKTASEAYESGGYPGVEKALAELKRSQRSWFATFAIGTKLGQMKEETQMSNTKLGQMKEETQMSNTKWSKIETEEGKDLPDELGASLDGRIIAIVTHYKGKAVVNTLKGFENEPLIESGIQRPYFDTVEEAKSCVEDAIAATRPRGSERLQEVG